MAVNFYTGINANSFAKSGGTSSQFLKADGSVDSNTYITSIEIVNDTSPQLGGNLDGNGFNIALDDGNSLSIGNFSINVAPSVAGGNVTALSSQGNMTWSVSEANHDIIFQTLNTSSSLSNAIAANGGGGVDLSYDGTVVLSTTAGGVTVTGDVEAEEGLFDGATNGNIDAESSKVDKFGILSNRATMYVTNQSATGEIAFGNNGAHGVTNLMRIKSDGDVGIGTIAPDEKLHVIGNVKATSFIKGGGTSSQYLMADGSVTTSGGSSPWVSDTNGITYTAGNVGIGTASQAALDLAVNGDARFNSAVRFDGNVDCAGGDLVVGNSIKDTNSAVGTAGQVLSSEGAGGGVEWVDAGVKSSTTGEPSGSDSIINIVSLTQAEYDAGTPVSTTLYIII